MFGGSLFTCYVSNSCLFKYLACLQQKVLLHGPLRENRLRSLLCWRLSITVLTKLPSGAGFTKVNISGSLLYVVTSSSHVPNSMFKLWLHVYKVETVGDCYVAAAGLPKPRSDHAVVMARFATDCAHRVQKLFTALEKTLGPDTGDLGCRFGLHSGQVVAGVLRGKRNIEKLVW